MKIAKSANYNLSNFFLFYWLFFKFNFFVKNKYLHKTFIINSKCNFIKNNYLLDQSSVNKNYNYFLLNFNFFFFNYKYNMYINYNLYKHYWINNSNRSYIMFHMFFLNNYIYNTCYFPKVFNFIFKEKNFFFYSFKFKKPLKKKKKFYKFKIKKRKIYKYRLLSTKQGSNYKNNFIDIDTILYYLLYKYKNIKKINFFKNYYNVCIVNDQKLVIYVKNRIYSKYIKYINNNSNLGIEYYSAYIQNTDYFKKTNLNFFLIKLRFFKKHRLVRHKKKFLKFFFISHVKNTQYKSLRLHTIYFNQLTYIRVNTVHNDLFFFYFRNMFIIDKFQFKKIKTEYKFKNFLKKKKRKFWFKFKNFLKKKIINNIVYWNDNFKKSIIKLYNKNNFNFYSNKYYYNILYKYRYKNKFFEEKFKISKHKYKQRAKYNHITIKQYNCKFNSLLFNFFNKNTPHFIYMYNNHFPLYNAPRIYIKYFYKKVYKSSINQALRPMHYRILSFLEKLIQKNFFLKFGGNNNVKHYKNKYEYWKLQLLYSHFKKYSSIKIHKTFRISEALEIIWYSFLIKDLTMLKQWFVSILQHTHYKNHKNFLNLFEILVKDQFKMYSYELKVKGFLFDTRGKISAASNAKKKKHNFIAGKINRASKFSKIDFQQTVIKSTGGILGVTMILHY